jgi:hypothetical protein
VPIKVCVEGWNFAKMGEGARMDNNESSKNVELMVDLDIDCDMVWIGSIVRLSSIQWLELCYFGLWTK